jgi:predicted transcriptional regulator
MKKVKQLIEQKEIAFNSVEGKMRVIDALLAMNALDVNYLVVFDHDLFRGIFTEKDYSRNVILKGKTSLTSVVSEVMSTNIPVVGPEDTLEYCIDLMNRYRSRYLVVFDERGEFLNVISMQDIIREIASGQQEEEIEEEKIY